MKQLEDMTEPELRDLTNRCLNAMKELLPPNTMFVVLFGPFGSHGIGQYGSNANRADIIQMLRETADRLERREDVTR